MSAQIPYIAANVQQQAAAADQLNLQARMTCLAMAKELAVEVIKTGSEISTEDILEMADRFNDYARHGKK